MNDSSLKQNHICSHHHAFSLNNAIRRFFQPPKKILGEFIQPGDTVLDIGCGPGFFTFPMAEMVGSTGSVIAIDLQQEMLEKVATIRNTTARYENVALHKCDAEGLVLENNVQADFILAYYMVHETPDQLSFFTETRQHLKNGGKTLIVEPPFHVSKKDFFSTLLIAEKAGLHVKERPIKKGGMSALLTCKT